MEELSGKREHLKIVVLLLIGFIIGFATHAFTTAGTAQKNDLPLEETTNITASSTAQEDVATTTATNNPLESSPINAAINNVDIGGYTLSIADQSAGDIVHVSHLVFAKNAWVTIRENKNEKLGNILGAAWYPAGTQTGSVSLLRNTVPGSLYYAVIYIDDGDKKFDFKKDTLLLDSTASVVATKFRAY